MCIDTLTASDYIEIFGILSSLLVSFVAIFISVKTLKQNNRMIENATRPYITIYLDSITICEQQSFFVLKNFGQSSGQINSFEYDPILNSLRCGNKESDHLLNNQFTFVKGITLAPGQSKLLLCDVPNIPKEILTFKIGYTSSEKYYEELIELNVKNYSHIPVYRPASYIPKGSERQVHSLREIIERLV